MDGRKRTESLVEAEMPKIFQLLRDSPDVLAEEARRPLGRSRAIVNVYTDSTLPFGSTAIVLICFK